LVAEEKLAELAACAVRERRAIGREDLQLLPLLLYAAATSPASASATTFVELGGLDGTTGSQTLVAELCFQWSGLLIEANPSNYATMAQCGRQRAKFAHSAVCAELGGTLRVTAGGGAVAGVVGQMPRRFAAQWAKLHSNATVEVPCAPLGHLMRREGFARSTYLSLDVEGAELLVLRTVTNAPFPFSIVLVEADSSNIAKNSAVRAILRGAGLKQLPIPITHGSNNEVRPRRVLKFVARPSTAHATVRCCVD
jgi:FkbM family methyltransferase